MRHDVASIHIKFTSLLSVLQRMSTQKVQSVVSGFNRVQHKINFIACSAACISILSEQTNIAGSVGFYGWSLTQIP